MLNLIFLTIILYIIIQHFIEESDDVISEIKKESNPIVSLNSLKDNINDTPQNRMGITAINNPPKVLSEARPLIHLGTIPVGSNNQIKKPFSDNKDSESKIMVFDKPNPWTKIIIVPLEEYPYFFHIKAKIPSLNDFESWKKVIPNINFDPRAGELIIPSKDEPSALALVNLILINFSGQMSMQNILEKNLIQISIAKAKTHELVQTKLREQIMENIYGKQFNSVQSNYQQDLAKEKTRDPVISQNSSNPDRIDFKSESFSDTFEHFSDNLNESKNIEAWDGNDFSYL
jgi:hypothetical protein